MSASNGVGTAHIRVDANGVLLDEATDVTPNPDQSIAAIAEYTTNVLENLIGHSNSFLFRSLGSTWHKGPYASEYLHYFINRFRGDTRFTDPSTPIPLQSEVENAISGAYQRLFATWIAANLDLLFFPATNATKSIQGFTFIQQERLFMNFQMFVVSEIVLGIYVMVSILLYIRRPGRYLGRMPFSIAAVVAMFAPSAAVKDLRNTSGMTNKERGKYLDDLEFQYGYGSYIGSGGAVHVGIEKAPHVPCLKEVTFAGSKAEREFRKTTAQRVRSIASVSSTEYVHVLDIDHVERSGDKCQTSDYLVSPLVELLRHDISVGLGGQTLDENVHGDRGNDASARRITV